MNPLRDGAKRRSPVSYILLALLAVATIVVWFGLRRQPKNPPSAVVVPVETVKPTVGALAKTITLDSYVESDSVVTVYPKVSGTLLSLDVDAGGKLNLGQRIGTIDPEPYRLAYIQAAAAFENAKAVFERQAKLRSSGSTTQSSFDQAQAQYEALRSQLELARLSLSYTAILSPVDGTVIARHVSQGALVSQSVPIVTVANRHDLIVQAAVPESYALLFQTKQSDIFARIRIPAVEDRSYEARIRSFSPAVDVRTKTFMVKCELDGNTFGILPGMFAQVTFVTEERAEARYLPYATLVGGDTLWYVDATGRAQPLKFVPQFHNDEFFEVPDSFGAYTFILSGQHFLSAGAPVRAVAAAATKTSGAAE